MYDREKKFTREEIGNRIKEIRGGLTYKEFAGKLGVSAGFVNGIEKGVKKPSAEMLFSMVNIFSVNLNWLLTGEGLKHRTYPQEETTPSQVDPLERALLAMFRELSPQNKGNLLGKAEELKMQELMEIAKAA